MADVKQITASDGTVYDIADVTARSALASKQETLVSGTNIKTINGESVLGSGNITISGGSDVLFVAEYGATTYAEISAALDANKLLFCYVSWNDIVCPYIGVVNSQYAFSNLGAGESTVSLYVNSSNTWSYATSNLATKITASGILKGDGSGGVSAATAGTDYVVPSGRVAVSTSSDKLNGKDTRSVNSAPSEYISSASHHQGVSAEFKSQSTIGAGASFKNFWQVVTHTPWTDTSGGVPVQEAFAVDTSGNPMMKIRGSATDGASWGSWTKIAFENNGSANNLINDLTTGSSAPTDADYYISQYAGGGTSTTTYHRRPHSALWTYIKGKADAIYAAISHDHAAGDITSGTLPVNRGGTGAASFTANRAIISGSTTTGAFTTRAITNNTSATSAITGSTNLLTMNTLRYALNRATGVASADTGYTTYMVRGTALVSSETTPTNNGQIAWVYE